MEAVVAAAGKSTTRPGPSREPGADASLVPVDMQTRARLAEVSQAAHSRDLDRLVVALRDQDERVCEAAASGLGRMKEPRAFDPLAGSTMKDTRPSVRAAACSALGELGEPEAVGPLSRALKDYEDMVREAAAVALGRLSEPDADHALVDFVKHEPRRSRAKLVAAGVLAHRGIARRRRSPKIPVWIGAAVGLGALGFASWLRLLEGLGPFNLLLAVGAVLALYAVWEWDRNEPDWRYLVRWRGEVFLVEGFTRPPPETTPPEMDPRWGGSGWGIGGGGGG